MVGEELTRATARTETRNASESGIPRELSRLMIRGKARPALLSFRTGNSVCDIQRGFDVTFGHKPHLGHIYFGYVSERAFDVHQIGWLTTFPSTIVSLLLHANSAQ
jgi:hypothetical protein